MKQDYKRFVQAGSSKSKVKEFNNFEAPSLFKGTGSVIFTTPCMPLHISFRIGLNNLNILENEVIELDQQIKSDSGDQTGEVHTLMDQIKHLEDSVKQEKRILEKNQDGLAIKRGLFSEMEKSNFELLLRMGRTYDVKTVEARAAQKLHKNLSNEIADLEKGNKIITKTVKNSKNDLVKGVFQTDLCNGINLMKLKRQVYHSGAIIGKDVNRLTKQENIKKLRSVFKPRLIKLPDGQIKVHSDTSKSVNVNTLLTKL